MPALGAHPVRPAWRARRDGNACHRTREPRFPVTGSGEPAGVPEQRDGTDTPQPTGYPLSRIRQRFLQPHRALRPGNAGSDGRCSINDTCRINPNRPPNELNSPLFLPCSRPKQGWGFSDRMRIPQGSGFEGHKGNSWRSR
jgi:hypothetical protein